MSEIKTVGVPTSGGDCAGLNAVIRAVTYRAIQGYGWKVLGILDATSGLIARPPRYRELTIGARTLDPEDALIRTARGLGIHLGEQRAVSPR